MDAGVVLGAIGAATGIGSFVAWWIERKDRKSQVADERQARERQFELERQRFEMERASHEARKHAEITAVQGAINLGEHRCSYGFELTNLGPSWAKHVTMWLADEETDLRLGQDSLVGPLDAGDQILAAIEVPRSKVDGQRTPVKLWTSWYDEGGGPHRERSNLTEIRLG